MASSNKYIPPAFRNKNRFATLDETTRSSSVATPKPDDFPSLTSPRTANNETSWKTKKSFAVLATEWNDHSEDEKMKEEYRRASEKREEERRDRDMRNVVAFKRHSNDHADTDELYDENETTPSVSQKDEWMTVEHSVRRREFSEEEKQLRAEARDAAEKACQVQEDSVWNTSNDDWDYRDRRTN